MQKMTNQDSFMYSLREKPDEGFALALYQGLLHHDRVLKRKQHLFIAVATVVATGLLMVGGMQIPQVRAAVLNTLSEVAGVQFEETDEYPGSRDASTIPYTAMPFLEAQKEFNISVPEWAPKGYLLQNTVYVGTLDNANTVIEITWRNASKADITLTIQSKGYTVLIGQESLQSIEINGKEVASWRGGWDYDQKAWNEGIDVVTLSWSDGTWDYHLSGEDQDDLVHMIESLP
jgi:hypothetical protein